MQSFLLFLSETWLLLVPLALGFVALWALMPPVREGRVMVPAALGLLGLILAGFIIPHATGTRTPLLFDVLFYLFAGLAVGSGATMIVQRNPVYAALWFAIVVLSVCGLFLLQSAPFLAAATIIIYAGAIIVTFLFVIMLAQQSGLAEYDRRSREPLLALAAAFLLLTGFLWALQLTFQEAPRLERISTRLQQSYEVFVNNREATAENVAAQLLFENEPVDNILYEEIARLPAWDRQAALRREIADLAEKVGAAVATKDKATLIQALARYRDLAEEIDLARQRWTGMVPVPPTRQAELSPLAVRAAEGPYVAGLGRTIFGDYLYAVAMAAVLLLAATIGAIVIAQRKPGEVL